MIPILCRCLTLCFLCSSVSALPLATPVPAGSSLGLFPLVISPIVILLVLKLGYLRYRRNQSNHDPCGDSPGASSSLGLRIGSLNIHVKFVQTTYLIGFLGSPTWETTRQHSASEALQRLRLRRRTSSYTPSPVLYSRMFGGSCRAIQAGASLPSPSLKQVMEPVLSAMASDPTASTLKADVDFPLSSISSAQTAGSGPYVDRRNTASSLNNWTIALYQRPSVAVPPPVHHVSSRPRSCNVTMEEWERIWTAHTPSANQLTPASVQDQSSKTHDPVISNATADVPGPLTPTTRPLNTAAKTRSLSPPSPMMGTSPPIEVLTGRRRAMKPLQKRRSSSPQIGPSPLRNSFVLESPARLPVVESLRPTSSTASVCPSWELDDLLINGQLDVNAVSAALGLGLSIASTEVVGEYDSRSGEHSSESHANISSPEAGLSVTSASLERACDTLPTTLQVHIPGEQLFAIPEEAEDVLSVDTSMRGSLHSRSTIIRLSEIDADFLAELVSLNTMVNIAGDHVDCRVYHEELLWQDEQRWRDNGDVSGR
ncbi:hypothetical protein DAEQUDRAFT_700979 [Daedalea quercina L-15889]|uniref:Uncharacterized protein n=1 Tax=Daedalea quercina L-15889 TaxID=1314783 RepID=A0A165UG81_9APHY|nr:hypothetical protein DAEQUDRAFT_700979 [Daedalea quercina L-15889]